MFDLSLLRAIYRPLRGKLPLKISKDCWKKPLNLTDEARIAAGKAKTASGEASQQPLALEDARSS